MTASARDRRRDLVDLLPQFLTRRMRGWDGLLPLLSERGLARQDALLLRTIVIETEPGPARPGGLCALDGARRRAYRRMVSRRVRRAGVRAAQPDLVGRGPHAAGAERARGPEPAPCGYRARPGDALRERICARRG